ncbi:MAG: hypothetical protein V3S64_01645 [bacterium]
MRRNHEIMNCKRRWIALVLGLAVVFAVVFAVVVSPAIANKHTRGIGVVPVTTRQGKRLELYKGSQRKQIPWYSSRLDKGFYFAQQKPRKDLRVVPSTH